MQALEQFGTDFELIQNLFPGRTRKQVKSKFKNEERLNPLRLSDALGHKTQGSYQVTSHSVHLGVKCKILLPTNPIAVLMDSTAGFRCYRSIPPLQSHPRND